MTENISEVTVNTNGVERKITEKDFLGKSKWQSQGFAEAHNLIYRLISVDDRPMFSMPTDKRTDRVCVEIKNGEVVKAIFQ